MSRQDNKPEKKEKELPPEDLESVVGGLVIEGVKGESTDDKHKDWIEITP